MPANAKYLTASPWQRFAKISAAILGGYFVAMSFHLAIAAWINHVNVLITSTFSGFIVWAALMIVAFLSKQGWRIWLLYMVLTIVFLGIAYLGKCTTLTSFSTKETPWPDNICFIIIIFN